MFERYTEAARRVIFFARYEASQFGEQSIGTHHLLLGLVRQEKSLMANLLPGVSPEDLRREIELKVEPGPKVSTSIDLPLTNECKRILTYSAEESARLGDRHLGVEHLLLGILREEHCIATAILQGHGARIEAIRESLKLANAEAPSSEPPPLSPFVNSPKALVAILDHLAFELPKVYLQKALASGEAKQWANAGGELDLFFESLMSAIEAQPQGAVLLAEIFKGQDWKSVRNFANVPGGLPEEDLWRTTLLWTLQLSGIIVERYRVTSKSGDVE